MADVLGRVAELIASAEERLDGELRQAESSETGRQVSELLTRDKALAGRYWAGRATIPELAAESGLPGDRVWLILNAFAVECLEI